MTLKKIIAVIIGLAFIAACGSARQLTKSADQQRDAKLVAQQLDARQYTIDINYMIPLAGMAKSVSGYYITVDGEKIDSKLPYAGKATSIPYGGGKGLSFDETIAEYKDSGWKDDQREVTMTISNDEDTYVYILTVFDNGSATLSVNCRNRDSISYRGNMVFNKD